MPEQQASESSPRGNPTPVAAQPGGVAKSQAAAADATSRRLGELLVAAGAIPMMLSDGETTDGGALTRWGTWTRGGIRVEARDALYLVRDSWQSCQVP
jgi:hypothetical protein